MLGKNNGHNNKLNNDDIYRACCPDSHVEKLSNMLAPDGIIVVNHTK